MLVANNGLGAVKFIRYVRQWASKTLGSERAIPLVAMASPDDLRVGAEHIRMADQFVEVPGGSNNNNYANVRLIVETAIQAQADAVWPGWGHASEYPELPAALEAAGIQFLGPPEGPMAALGDKVGSSIIAQAAGVPTLAWSGSHVSVGYADCGGVIPDDVYAEACIGTVEEAVRSCTQIGFPVMIKASWGGGGKGIRKVGSVEEAVVGFKQVQAEVPGSPIFAMKMAANARHLEVQLLADKHGNVTSVFSRDCSTQRRHQKIVEEGPVTVAPQETLRRMERAAADLARAVGYVGAATVEYLFSPETGDFCFLELNPRLQVEHPVTEGISHVNIPSCQLMIGMGIPLHAIPDIRRLYDADPTETSPLDFVNGPTKAPDGHIVAVRITSEDADNGFKPTCGAIDEISFHPTPDVWGYFSVKPGGGVHEFADSQFGHLFARGDNRNEAINNMVIALGDLKIRGEIMTIATYVEDMIQCPDWRNNRIHTGWLDERIAQQVRPGALPWHVAVVGGAVHRAEQKVNKTKAAYVEQLKMGQTPAPITVEPMAETIIVENVKYEARVSPQGPGQYRVSVGGAAVDVVARPLVMGGRTDGGLRVQLDGSAHMVHAQETALGTRLQIGQKMCLLEEEKDPSTLMAVTAGKLVKWLVEDGAHVAADEPYAEMEVMKMLMPLVTPAAGVLRALVNEGAPVAAGEVLARLDLDDPSSVKRAVPFAGALPPLGPPRIVKATLSNRFADSLEAARLILAGYDRPVDKVAELFTALDDPSLALDQWNGALAVVRNRLPGPLVAALQAATDRHAEGLRADPAAAFPSAELAGLMARAVEALPAAEQQAAEMSCEELGRICAAHEGGRSQHSRRTVKDLLERFLAVEEAFGDRSNLVVLHAMRAKGLTPDEILEAVLAHQAALPRSQLVLRLLSNMVLPEPRQYHQELRRLASIEGRGPGLQEVALKSKQLLEHSMVGRLRAMVARALSSMDMFSAEELEDELVISVGGPGTPGRAGGAGAMTRRMVMRKMTQQEGLYSGLEEAILKPTVEERIAELAHTQAAVDEPLAVLLDHPDRDVQLHALQAYVRRTYAASLVPGSLRLEPLPDAAGGGAPAYVATWRYESASSAKVRTGAMGVLPSLARLPAVLEAALQSAGPAAGQDGNTLHLALVGGYADAVRLTPEATELCRQFMASRGELAPPGPGGSDSDAEAFAPEREDRARVALAITAGVNAETERLQRLGVNIISVLRPGTTNPRRWGFLFDGGSASYLPDQWTKGHWHVEPPVASLLELAKLKNRQALHSRSRNRQWHLYVTSEKVGQRTRDIRRVFLRGIVRRVDSMFALAVSTSTQPGALAAAVVGGLESFLASALEELERAQFDDQSRASGADWVHVYFSVLPAKLPADTGDPTVAEALRRATAKIAGKNAAKLRQMNVAAWEFRVPSARGGAWRVCVSSPSGFEAPENHIEVYREARAPDGGGLVYEPLSPGGAAPALAGRPILEAYPPLETLERKRLAAKRLGTTYVYDFPALFQAGLEELWGAYLGRVQVPGFKKPAAEALLASAELALAPPDAGAGPYARRLAPVARPPGANDVGMIVWEWTLRTPEAPEGRRVVVVANDVSHNAGSFGPLEDAVFKAAVDHALARKLPVVYLAANAGARFGVAEEVRERFQIEWANPANPAKGFKYLYLDDADYQRLREFVTAEPVRAPDGLGTRWKLDSVIGRDDGLGVECLSGSGAIAAAFSRAYQEGFTLTFVTSRTVGIGAYLARLGHRVVQRSDQPIILTGYGALNKLLGSEVYTSHLQLGGPRVMHHNGVSHLTVDDDLEGAKAVLDWLSYVPPVLDQAVAVLEPMVDPVQRALKGAPADGAALPPRLALCGGAAADGGHVAGLFDAGSWMEVQPNWAKTVITGQARLGGIPVGVIAVEVDTVNNEIPVDPGDPTSAARVTPQAGKVWHPDSAAKTAQAMEEFNRQGLPLMIFANWRGFSGGTRDLFDGVLQAGSLIVENLRTYRHPAFVYLPPGAELRGGAWVVVDHMINPDQVEMYADPTARGGVLEPEGLAEVKYREKNLLKTMHRLERALPDDAGARRAREKALLPVYKQAAVEFIDMHDKPDRMLAKGVLSGVVPWAQARAFFYWRLKRRVMEQEIFGLMRAADPGLAAPACRALLGQWRSGEAHAFRRSDSFSDADLTQQDDIAFVTWAALEKGGIEDRVHRLALDRQQQDVAAALRAMMRSGLGRAGVERVVAEALKAGDDDDV